MTGAELRAQVKALMNLQGDLTDVAVDQARPTNSQIDAAVNFCRAMLWAKIGTDYRRKVIVTKTVAYTADAESVSLPTGAVGQPIYQVEWTPNGATSRQKLDAAQLEEFRDTTRKGLPAWYVIMGSVIGVRPIPSSAGVLTIWCVPAVTALTTSTSPSELHPDFHHIIATMAAIRLRRGLGDPTQGLEDQLQEDQYTMLAYYESLNADNSLAETGSTWSKY